MTGLAQICCLGAFALSGQAASDLPSRDDAWVAARNAMVGALGRLENFSCVQNIRREISVPGDPSRSAGTRQDFVRLQVTNIGGKEHYSFPGDLNSVTQPQLLVKSGLSGTGMFLGYARTVFLKHPFSSLKLEGREVWQGRPALRFSFEFDRRERLDVSRAGGSGSIGAGGDFLVDAEDFLLRRMRIVGNQPLPELGIRQVTYDMNWSLIRGGATPLLVPEQVEVRMELFSGEVQRNEIHLAQCREFQAQTSLRFDEDESGDTDLSQEDVAARIFAELAVSGPAVLPAELQLQLRLDEELDLAFAAVGDGLSATLQRDVVTPDGMVLPQGTIAELRVRRLDVFEKPELHAVVWLELSVIRSEARVYLGLARLEDRDRARGMVDRLETRIEGRSTILTDLGAIRTDVLEEVIYPSIPGVGAFLFRGGPGKLPAGYRMTWRTLPARADQNP